MEGYAFYLCQAGDLFVTLDGKPVSSPYDKDLEFWKMLAIQPHVVFNFHDCRDFARAAHLFEGYLEIWRKQLPKVREEAKAEWVQNAALQ